MRGLAILGLYLLAGIAGEVGDGDLAGYDVLHGGARSRERVLHEGEVDVRRATLAGELLGHVARDVAHEALGRPIQPLDGILRPGELPGTALGDLRAGLLEGAVVDRAGGTARFLYLFLGVADGAPAALHLGSFTAGLLAVLLGDVVAGDRGVTLLERALLDPRLDPALLLPLFEGVEQGRRVVGPVQLAAVVDLGEVQVLVARRGRYLRINRVEVRGPRSAHGATGRLALRHVAADVALEAVLALGGTLDLLTYLGRDALDVALVLALTKATAARLEDLLFHRRVTAVGTVGRAVLVAVRPVAVGLLGGALVEVLEQGVYGLVLAHGIGGAHLVADGTHGLHGAGREDALDHLVYDAGGYDGVTLLDGVTDDGARRHPHHEAGDTVEALQRLLGPRHVLFGRVEVRSLVLVVRDKDVRGQVAHHVFGVAADVHLVVGVVADAAHDDHRRVDLVHVLHRLLERLACEERRLQLIALVLGDLPGYLQVGRVDLGQPRVDDLLVQLLLLLEAEDLLGLGGENTSYGVEHRVVEVGVEDGDSLHRPAELASELDRPLQTTERLGRPVDRHHDVLERRAVEVLHDQGVRLLQAPDDPLRDRAEDRVLHGGHAHSAHHDEVEVVRVHVLDYDLEVLAFQRASHQLDVVLLAERLEHVDVGVGDDLQALGDELVMDLALPLHLVFVAELLGEPALHLAEADVVHLRGVGVATRDPAPELPRHVDPDDARLVGVVRVVDRDVDLSVHIPRSPSFAVRREIRSVVARKERHFSA